MAAPMQFNNQLQSYRADTGQSFQPRSGIKNWFKGNPERFSQAPKYSPEIQQSVNDLLGQGFQGLQNPYQGFDNISNEATRRFNTETIPGIAERFAAVPGGGHRSSAYQAALAGSGEDFQSKLAAMKEMFGQRNRQQSLEQIGFGLQNQPEFQHLKKQRGWLEGLLSPFASGGNYEGSLGGQEEIASLIQKLLPLLMGL